MEIIRKIDKNESAALFASFPLHNLSPSIHSFLHGRMNESRKNRVRWVGGWSQEIARCKIYLFFPPGVLRTSHLALPEASAGEAFGKIRFCVRT